MKQESVGLDWVSMNLQQREDRSLFLLFLTEYIVKSTPTSGVLENLFVPNCAAPPNTTPDTTCWVQHALCRELCGGVHVQCEKTNRTAPVARVWVRLMRVCSPIWTPVVQLWRIFLRRTLHSCPFYKRVQPLRRTPCDTKSSQTTGAPSSNFSRLWLYLRRPC